MNELVNSAPSTRPTEGSAFKVHLNRMAGKMKRQKYLLMEVRGKEHTHTGMHEKKAPRRRRSRGGWSAELTLCLVLCVRAWAGAVVDRRARTKT